MTKRRIWEIDAFRGLCILLVFVSHLSFDLQNYLNLSFDLGLLQTLFDYGGLVFVVVSGVSATLGSRSFRRGLVVFGCGMVITLVTYAMAALNLMSASLRIQFGVLHLLGVCMMLYPALKKLPTWALAVGGAVVVALGWWFSTFYLPEGSPTWLFPLGLRAHGFTAGDYFPIFPHLGWFMLGISLGRTVYREKRTLLPRVNEQNGIVRFFTFAGRHSLELYLIHQPVIYGIIQLTLLF